MPGTGDRFRQEAVHESQNRLTETGEPGSVREASMIKLFDEIPCLEDDRIVLRKLDGRDTEALLELTGSESVYWYLPTYLHEKQYTDMDLMLRDLYGK